MSPATKAVSERSASAMCRIKNWLRSTMSQERLNHCMLLSIHKEKTDEINLKNVATVFCEANEERRRTFGIFFFFIHVLNKSLKFIFASNEFKKPEKYIMKTYLSALFHILPNKIYSNVTCPPKS